MTETETLERARHALEAHAWQQAYEGFVALDEQGLSSEDLERLAQAAWWSAHPNESIEAFERAFASFSAEGRGRDAARVGLRLALEHADRQESAVSNGWLQRATRLLADEPECSEQGWLELCLVRSSFEHGEFEEAERHATARPGDRCAAGGPGHRGVRPGARGRDPRVPHAGRAGARARRRGDPGRRRGRALAVRRGQHLLPDDRDLPERRRLPAGVGVDRGGRTMVRARVDHRLPRGLPRAAGRDLAPARFVRRGRGRGRQGADRARGVRAAPAGGGGGERGGRGASAPRRSRRRRGGVRAGPPARERAAAGDGLAPSRARPGRRGPVVDRHRARGRGGPVRPGTPVARARRDRAGRVRRDRGARGGGGARPDRGGDRRSDAARGRAPGARRDAHVRGGRRGRDRRAPQGRPQRGPRPTRRSRPPRRAAGWRSRTAPAATRRPPSSSSGRPRPRSRASGRSGTPSGARR